MNRPVDPRMIQASIQIISEELSAGGPIKKGIQKCQERFKKGKRTIERWWEQRKK